MLRRAGRDAPRVVLYSHDTMGLGHTRRNLLIARVLAAPPISATVLMVTGIRESGSFRAPPGVDFVTLPAYRKGLDGRYESRDLDIDVGALSQLRAQAIKAAVSAFSPDLMIVDNVPTGALGELLPTLEALSRKDSCRRVLGLRDVLDDPRIVRGEWRRNFDVIRDHFQKVWVYGDPKVYDTAGEYDFPLDVRLKTTFTGYLNPIPPQPATLERRRASDVEDLILCTVGGGQDGFRLASAFAATRFQPGTRGMIVTGPFMAEECRQSLLRQAEANSQLIVRGFESDPLPLIRRAKRVITMGGYNTVIELLALNKQALVAPRTKPRLEQMIRAERLKMLGLVECIPEEDITGEDIGSWLVTEPSAVSATQCLDFHGLDRIVGLASEVLNLGNLMSARPPLFPTQEDLRAAI